MKDGAGVAADLKNGRNGRVCGCRGDPIGLLPKKDLFSLCTRLSCTASLMAGIATVRLTLGRAGSTVAVH